MALSAGTQIGTFEIISLLGRGGMGEVYRARDTRLGREVALKVLPESVAEHPERLARFEREARLLAALNHPNIAAIYGIEHADDTRFLVLELVRGLGLDLRFRKGRMPFRELCSAMQQVAEALESAHAQGILHRDLKPANIKITPEGKLKVLDFGLGKAFDVDSDDEHRGETLALDTSLTGEGTVLGTPAYMSPEQARGKEVDKRTDIWAFGCIFFEGLTGKRTFAGPTPQDTLAAVLERQPDWSTLPPNVPPNIQSLLRRCLQKDTRRRLQDMGDARIELEETLKNPNAAWGVATSNEQRRAGHLGRVLFGLALGLILGTLVGALVVSRMSGPGHGPAEDSPLLRFEFRHPDEFGPARIEMPALTRDGRKMAYVASTVGERRIYLHDFSSGETTSIPETEGASGPFFSPRGDWLGFFHFDQSRLKKISLKGGRPITLAESQIPLGGLWAEDNFIYYSKGLRGGLMRVSADGGEPEVVTELDREREEIIHALPSLLPDRRGMLLTRAIVNYQNFETVPLLRGEPFEMGETLAKNAGYGRVTSSGHVVFFRDANLMASRFDLADLRPVGPEVPVVTDLGLNPLLVNVVSLPQYDLSDNGVLVYVGKSPGRRQLVWVDEEGRETLYSDSIMPFRQPHISPDGRRVAVTIDDAAGSTIWVGDVERGTFTRLTFEGHNFAPVWSPDGQGLVFTSSRAGEPNLYWQPIDGSEPARRLTRGPFMHVASSWRPGTDEIGFIELTPGDEGDLRMIRFSEARGENNGEELLPNSTFDESKPVFSPNGRWLAYESNESGSTEIYVRPYPGSGGKIPISNRGGLDPLWSADGKRLFYWEGSRIMAVDVNPEGPLDPSIPRSLFEGGYWGDDLNSSYDVSPLDRRLLMVKRDEDADSSQVTVVVNWLEELERLIPEEPEP